jgi:hypothetical protein
MIARQLVELAAWVSMHGSLIVRDGQRLCDDRLELYWVASKCRLDRWVRILKQQRDARYSAHDARRDDFWCTLEEILVSEVLTRVWTTVLMLYDRRRELPEAEPVGRSVFIGHLEARHRALQLMLACPEIETETCLRIDCLRRSLERWTDLLVGLLAQGQEYFEYAANPDRAAQLCAQYRPWQSGIRRQAAWQSLLATIRLSGVATITRPTLNPDLNAQIGASIVGCFPPTMFDSTGWPRSMWLSELARGADDAHLLVEDLFAPQEQDPAAVKLAVRRVEIELRRRNRFES